MPTRKRWLLGAGVTFAAIVAVVGVRQCDPFLPPYTDFSYMVHLRPRVFVMHEPLVPAPSAALRLTVVPDVDSSASVVRAVAQVRTAPNGPIVESECPPQDGVSYRCELTLDASEGERIYSAYIELSSGERVSTLGSYRFTVLRDLPVESLVPVRVPVNPSGAVTDDYRVDAAIVRDLASLPSNSDFMEDAHRGIFRGVLNDPIYRWRDVYLGFWLFARGGVVSSYYSGLDTRCGKNPWPNELELPSALSGMEVVGVIHRQTTTEEGIEGAGTPHAKVAFRDCAGELVKKPVVRSFSASGGLSRSAAIFKHEYAHAAFGVGDEYHEDETTRRVAPALLPINDQACCCRNDDSDPGVVSASGRVLKVPSLRPGYGSALGAPGGAPVDSTKTCVARGGGSQTSPLFGSDQLPSCDGFTFPPTCGVKSDGECPSLSAACVQASAWLGLNVPETSSPRPNVFRSADECQEKKQVASAHPGVLSTSLGICRQLCGPNIQPCPCEAPDVTLWVVDVDVSPPLKGIGVGDTGVGLKGLAVGDSMSRVASPPRWHGGTCAWCVETTLCVRWHRARGDATDEAWAKCDAPPKEAAWIEQFARSLSEWLWGLVGWLRDVVST